MSEVMPLQDGTASVATTISDVSDGTLNNPIVEEGVSLLDTHDVHGYTQIDWDLFWGFAVDYEFKLKGLLTRVQYNGNTFALNYMVLIMFMLGTVMFVIYRNK